MRGAAPGGVGGPARPRGEGVGGAAAASPAARRAYKPVAAELEACGPAGLLVVPTFDSDLFMVPWAALVRPEGRRLVEAHAIRLPPSLGVACSAAAPPPPPASARGAGWRAVVVGDPTPLTHPGFRRLPHAAEEERAVRDALGWAGLLKRFKLIGYIIGLGYDITANM